MFEKAVKRRGVGNVRINNKYLLHMSNTNLIGLSGNARDLKDFIEHKISSIASISDVNYRIKVDNAFKDEFNLYLERNNCKALSISTMTRVINELKERRVLLPISKGYYLYNFVDYCHVGNREQYANDIKFFGIEELLNKVDNK